MSSGIGTPVARDARLDEAIDLMRGTRVAVLTGAGVSTDSGIPDYRGEGAPVRTPMSFQAFAASEAARKRYWAGSHLGWRSFAGAQPNRGHRGLATLESGGVVTGVVTQNVDGLHRRAGSRHVVELHGGMDRVVCLTCGQHYARQAIAERLADLNSTFDLDRAIRARPDGDVDIDDADAMVIPACTVCGGILKPDVVFFGEFVPPETFRAAASVIRGSETLLVAGSSLVVNSGMRLIELARRQRMPIIVVNRGITRADSRAAVKIDAGASETISAMASALLA